MAGVHAKSRKYRARDPRTSEKPMTTAVFLSILLLQQPAEQPQAQTIEPADEIAQVLNDSMVRMRKLHLVRPELLPYPLAYEVYC